MEYDNDQPRRKHSNLGRSFSYGNYFVPAGTRQAFYPSTVGTNYMAMPGQQQQQPQLFPQGAAMLPPFQPQQYYQQVVPAGMSQQANMMMDWTWSQPAAPFQSISPPQIGQANNWGSQFVNGTQSSIGQQMTVDQTLFNANGSVQTPGPIGFDTIDPSLFWDQNGNDIGVAPDGGSNQLNAGAQTFGTTGNWQAQVPNTPVNFNSQFQGMQQGQQQFNSPAPVSQPVVSETTLVAPASQLTLPIRQASPSRPVPISRVASGLTLPASPPRPAPISKVASGLTLPASPPAPAQPAPQQQHAFEPLFPGSGAASLLTLPSGGASPVGNDLGLGAEEAEEAGPSTPARRSRARKSSAATKRRCQARSCVECRRSKTGCFCDDPNRGKTGLARCKRCTDMGLACVWDETDARSRKTLAGDVDDLAQQAAKLIECSMRIMEVLDDQEDFDTKAFVLMLAPKGDEPETIHRTMEAFKFNTRVKDARALIARKSKVREAAINAEGNLPGYRRAKNRLKELIATERRQYHDAVNGFLAYLRGDQPSSSSGSSPASEPVITPAQEVPQPADAMAIEPAIAGPDHSQSPLPAAPQASKLQAEFSFDQAGFDALAAFTHGSAAQAPAAPQATPEQEPAESFEFFDEPMASDDDDLFGDIDFLGGADS